MEDIIDASPPPSQRKRRNNTKCHISQKKSKRDVCNVENGIDLKPLDFQCSDNSPVDQIKPNSLTRSDILRNVHIQEQANKASSQKVHPVKRCNNRSESRISTRSGFLSASQYSICASQSSSAQKFGENCVLNSGVAVTSNCNTLFETQGFTESQFQIMDNDEKLNTIANDEQPKSISLDTENISQKDIVSIDSVQLGVTLSPNVHNRIIKNTSEDAVNASQHSVKRCRSIVESILNEWPTSPDEKNTPDQVTQFSPKFKFDKKLILRTYLTKRRSPATTSTCSAIGFNSSNDDDNLRKEIGQEEIVPANVNEEEVDLNKSVKIIDNIQNLSQFYSQTSETGVHDVNETFKAVMDSKCHSSIKPSPSLEDEGDFFGFDNKSITLPENFYDFHSDSDDEVSNTNIIDQHHDILADNNEHHDMLADDDDIFVNFNLTQVNISAGKDDLFHEELSTASKHNERNARSIALGGATNIFEDIENDYGLAPTNNCFLPPPSSELKHVIPSNLTTPTYPSFSTFGISHLPVSSASSLIKTNLCENIEVKDEKKMNNWIDESKVFGLSENLQNISHVRPNPTYAGFSTARGKQISVSSALISKKTNFFQNIEVSDDDLKKMNNWIDDNERESDIEVERPARALKENISSMMTTPTFAGFSTLTGKQIPVSSRLLSKKRNIFQDLEVTDDDLRNMNNYIDDNEGESDIKIDQLRDSSATALESTSSVMPIPTFAGFSTARGKQIPVSSELISKKTNIFEKVEVTNDDLRKMNWIDDNERGSDIQVDRLTALKESTSSVMPIPTFAGFSTPTGKQIPVSSTLLSKKTNIFQDLEVTDDDLRNMNNYIDDNERGSNINIDLLKQNTSSVTPVPTFVGFSTPTGKPIPVSSALFSKKTNIFKDLEVTDDDLRNMNNWIDDKELDAENKVNSFSENPATVSKNNITNFRPNGIRNQPNSFHIAGKNNFPGVFINEKTNQSNSVELFREVTNSLHPPTTVVPHRNMLMGRSDKSPINTFIKPSPLRKMSMVNSLRKLENESLKENVQKFENGKTSPAIHTPTSSKGYICVTPPNNTKTLSQDCREAIFCLLDDEMSPAEDGTPGYIDEINAHLIASSTPIRKTDSPLSRPKQTRLVEKFDDLAGEDYIKTKVQSEPKVQIPFDILSLRRKAIEKQQQSINGKANIKPVPGTLYVNKLTEVKVKWKEFVENSRPTTIGYVLPNSAPKVSNNVLHVTTENATKFKFNAWDHYSDDFCRENVNGIHLRDDIVVMMDENCQIGLNEISNAFLSCPSVDPKLIHDKWIENNVRWIVIKLAGMERSFPHRFAGKVLTTENLMLQLKYRYEREIDHVERSAIRKICEMDDIAAKRMILFVARIKTTGHQCELELSDGWYGIMSTLDSEMSKLVSNGKINVGTKLVIQGAEIENLENGCHPLDVPSNVRLKLFVNSTRRARWDTKLGYYKNPGPFKISLRSVQAFGGKITKLIICVLRVYPVVYCDWKSPSGMQIHSEKVERRRSMKEEQDRSIIYEKVYDQISKDFEDEEKADRHEKRPKKVSKLSDISTITDPAVLFDLLEDDNDPERIENEMTTSQKNMLLNYKDKVNCSRREEINNRIKAKMAVIDKSKGKYFPLLKFKIADEMSFDKTALVTISRPTDDMFSLIQEGTVYEMTSAKTKGFDQGIMQIYAGRETIFKKLHADGVPSAYCRHHTSISEIISTENPVLNELDTVGFVVHVGDATSQLQPVYIADAHRNIVCIYFWTSLTKYAYDDVVTPKRFLAVKNLQWRSSSNSKPIPCTFATEYSIFTENPTSSELLSAMTRLKMKFESVKIEEFIDACMTKINSHKPPFPLTPARTSSMSSMQSSDSSLPTTPKNVSHSTLSNQNRIELLNKYGDGMPLPPIHINSLNKSFKLPLSEDC